MANKVSKGLAPSVALAFSVAKREERGESRGKITKHVISKEGVKPIFRYFLGAIFT